MVKTNAQILEAHAISKKHKIQHGHYASYIRNNPLNKTEYQRLCPHVLLYCILNAIAKYNQKNYIVTNLGDRNKIFRGANKLNKVFNKQYKLLAHADGKFKSVWFIGNPAAVKIDHKGARTRGPRHYYMPGHYITFAIALAKNICDALIDFYDKCLEFSKTRNRFVKHVITCAEPLRKKMNVTPMFINEIMRALLAFSKAGYREHLQGNSFGHKVGRPGHKCNMSRGTYNPRLFMSFVKSEEGQKMVDEHISAISRNKKYFSRHRRKNCFIKSRVMCLIFDTDASDRFRIALREAVCDGTLTGSKDKLRMILDLLPARVVVYWDEANRLEQKDIFARPTKAKKQQKTGFNLHAHLVHNDVHNSEKEELNTEHYTSSNIITHEVNKTAVPRLPDLGVLKEYLPTGIRIEDKFLAEDPPKELFFLEAAAKQQDVVTTLLLKAKEIEQNKHVFPWSRTLGG